MLISRLVIIIYNTKVVPNNILLLNWLHSIHCPTGAVCRRSDLGFNKCVAEKLNDLRDTVAKGKNFTNRSDTKIGNWRLITSCDQLVPTPFSVATYAPYYVLFICDQLYRLKTTLLLLLLWQLGNTVWISSCLFSCQFL